jgi:hypothetical protein
MRMTLRGLALFGAALTAAARETRRANRGRRHLVIPGRTSAHQRKAGGPPWSARPSASSSAKKFGTWFSAS